MSTLQATWYAVRVSGAWPHEAEYVYTSADPPVEATEYEHVLAQLAAMTARANAAEAYRAEWQQAAQAYGDYRQRCAENNTDFFDFWDWGMKGEPTGEGEVQP